MEKSPATWLKFHVQYTGQYGAWILGLQLVHVFPDN